MVKGSVHYCAGVLPANEMKGSLEQSAQRTCKCGAEMKKSFEMTDISQKFSKIKIVFDTSGMVALTPKHSTQHT